MPILKMELDVGPTVKVIVMLVQALVKEIVLEVVE